MMGAAVCSYQEGGTMERSVILMGGGGGAGG
jgi:hypothetical protein